MACKEYICKEDVLKLIYEKKDMTVDGHPIEVNYGTPLDLCRQIRSLPVIVKTDNALH